METVADSQVAENPQPPEGGCEHCGKTRPIMVAMKPGPDGKPWRLCSGCYLDGLRPMNQISAEKPSDERPILSTEMGKALEASGHKITWVDPEVAPKKSKRKRSA